MLKSGVDLRGLAPQMALAYTIAADLYRTVRVPCVITCGVNGQHKVGSLHPLGRAVDLRTKTVPRHLLPLLIARLRDALGDQFDVVLEDLGGPNEHVHVEFDPRDAPKVQEA